MRYYVAPDLYADRRDRMAAATKLEPGATIEPERIRAILAEVEPIPFEPGRRYRIVLYAGTWLPKAIAGIDEKGVLREVTMPEIVEGGWHDLEVTYLGRFAEGALRGLHAFRMIDGSLAAAADMDVQRAEELPDAQT